MADDKRFWWIKLKTDFFAEDTPIDGLLSLPNGSEYVCLYLKLCLMTANKQGRLCNQYGDMLIPYNIEKIQQDMKFFSIDTVRVALELYKKFGLIYEEADGVLRIAHIEDMIGSETKWAGYKRQERIGNGLDNVQQSIDIRDKSIDKKYIAPAKPAACAEIIDYLNKKIGTNYKPTTDKTQRCIKARWAEGYTLEDFKAVIDKKAEEWIGGEMEKYLRPETLFGPKFESYLNSRTSRPAANKNAFTSHQGADTTDYAALQKKIFIN